LVIIGLNQAEQSAKNAEVAFQEACSQYNRVMSIKAGTKGGGKGKEFVLDSIDYSQTYYFQGPKERWRISKLKRPKFWPRLRLS
jgi:hypothetical protein